MTRPRPDAAERRRLVVLDMAGTTVADGGVVEASFVDALSVLGVGTDHPDHPRFLDEVRRTMGMSKIVVFRAMFGDEALAQQANTAFEEAFARRVRDGAVVALPGAEDALAALRAGGCRTCLTTGFSPETQRGLVDALGWRQLVDLWLAPDDELRGRPYPDLVLAAVLRLRIDDVRDVTVVGDTANDLVAGTRAGAGTVVGVLTGAHTREQLAAAPHTHLLGSVAELPALLGLG